jgi:hypothetical protein
MIMAIPMNATIAMTPGLISKGYAALLPHKATFDEKLVIGRSNCPGAYPTVYATVWTTNLRGSNSAVRAPNSR